MICHSGSEALEKYAISGLPEEDLEEHLLVCGDCREELAETEIYVDAMRWAATELRRNHPRRGWMPPLRMAPRPMWAASLASAVLAILALNSWRGSREVRGAPVAVALAASRGSEATEAPAGHPLIMTIDLTELPPFPEYRLEAVNAVGERRAQCQARPAGGSLQATIVTPLEAGTYFVRLYSPQQEFLREYALELRDARR